METDREKINFKRDQEGDINSIEVVYEVVHDSPVPEVYSRKQYISDLHLRYGFTDERYTPRKP